MYVCMYVCMHAYMLVVNEKKMLQNEKIKC